MVAPLQPDLILAPNVVDPKIKDQLNQIAPVYTFTLRGGDRANWQKRVEEVANAINASGEYTKLKNDFEARQKAMATKYASAFKGKTVSVIDSYEADNLYVWGPKTMVGSIIGPLGLQWNAAEDKLAKNEKGENENQISPERLADVLKGSDIVLYGSDLKLSPSPFMKTILANPLYTQNPAVKAGHAFPIGKDTVAGFGDANFTLDQMEKAAATLTKK